MKPEVERVAQYFKNLNENIRMDRGTELAEMPLMWPNLVRYVSHETNSGTRPPSARGVYLGRRFRPLRLPPGDVGKELSLGEWQFRCDKSTFILERGTPAQGKRGRPSLELQHLPARKRQLQTVAVKENWLEIDFHAKRHITNLISVFSVSSTLVLPTVRKVYNSKDQEDNTR